MRTIMLRTAVVLGLAVILAAGVGLTTPRERYGPSAPIQLAPATTAIEPGDDGADVGVPADSRYAPLLDAIRTWLGPVPVIVTDAPITANDEAHRTAENPGGSYGAIAKVRCLAGDVPELTYSRAALADPVAVLHEYLHATDCADDGLFNGSQDPTAGAEVPGDPAHSWVYWAERNPETATRLVQRWLAARAAAAGSEG